MALLGHTLSTESVPREPLRVLQRQLTGIRGVGALNLRIRVDAFSVHRNRGLAVGFVLVAVLGDAPVHFVSHVDVNSGRVRR